MPDLLGYGRDPGTINGIFIIKESQQGGVGFPAPPRRRGLHMKLTYSVTIEDLVMFNLHHSEHSPFMRRARRNHQIYSPLSVLVALGLLGFIAKSWTYPVVGAVFAAAFAAMAPGRFRKQIRHAAERCYKEGENKGMLGVHSLEILDAELRETNPTGSQSIKWAGIERVVSTPTHGYVYVSSNAAHVIPRASVAEGDYDAFMEAVRDRLAMRNPPPSGPAHAAQGAKPLPTGVPHGRQP